MSSDLPASARPAPVVFYNDPRVRSIAYQVALCAVVVFLVYGAASNAIENLARARIASGFGFWDQTRRLRHQPDADRLFVARFDLWPRVLGRTAQHAAGGRDRHRSCDHSRLRHRHLAAVQQLAGGESCGRLRRNDPQPAAAAAIAVLVQRSAQDAARYPRQYFDRRGHFSQQSRPVSADTDFQRRVRRSGDRLACRNRRRDCLSHLGTQTTRAHRPTGAGVVGHACAGDRAAARDLHRSRVLR